MKKYIEQVLGNSLRCILPSFWWKKLLGKMVDEVDKAKSAASSASQTARMAMGEVNSKQDKLSSGSNIKTINGQTILGGGNLTIDSWELEKYDTVEELKTNIHSTGGEVASVVNKTYTEKSFDECYKPTSSELNSSYYNAKFTQVTGIVINPNYTPSLILSNYYSIRIVLYSDGNSKGIYYSYPRYLSIDYSGYRNGSIICYEYSDNICSGHYIYSSNQFYSDNINKINKILQEGNFRFSYLEVSYSANENESHYYTYYHYSNGFPSNAFAMVDNFIKMRYAETNNADIYVKSSDWVKLLKEGDVVNGNNSIVVDSELSETSEQPVQNKVVTQALLDNEVVFAAALSDLEARITDMKNSIKVFKVWFSETMILTEEQINDNKDSYWKVINGGTIDKVANIAENGFITNTPITTTGVENNEVLIHAFQINFGDDVVTEIEDTLLILSEDGAVRHG